MKPSTALLPALAAAALAAPAKKEMPRALFPIVTRQSILATFDDRSAGLVTDSHPVGVYDNLNWPSFTIGSPGLAGNALVGIQPQSKPNYADGPGQMTTTGNTAFFDFKSFYFGCNVQTNQVAAQVPTGCTVTLVGNRVGLPDVTASFTFTPPTGAVSVPMIQAFLPANFVGLTAVSYSVNSGVLGTPVSLHIDNVAYITYNSL